MKCFVCVDPQLIYLLHLALQLLQKISRHQARTDWDACEVEQEAGRDFLFLFDLLAHTSGIESTLRVLTHSDETFRQICLPKLRVDTTHIKVEEDKLRLSWSPAPLEAWLQQNSHKGITIGQYDVTIFPAESLHNSVTKYKRDKDPQSGLYSAWFFDLSGGRTEYVVTVACVIGQSRMKGERLVTTLLPYGPGKPRAGMVKATTTDEIELIWEPPKGGFTKYVVSKKQYCAILKVYPLNACLQLCVDPTVTSCRPNTDTVRLQNGIMNPNFYCGDTLVVSRPELAGSLDTDYSERELSGQLTEHKLTGLSPGSTYGIGTDHPNSDTCFSRLGNPNWMNETFFKF